ncbi:MAG: RNA polymerase sigma factor [Rikenellaceae bacterium]|jgi:RNA polymerase sigma-70 factor (ECF subfamily)|nr:RNA polymerase sigma factor [Rikenellaceae bacterium]
MGIAEDSRLAERVRSGDEGAYPVLVDRFGAAVFPMICRIVGSREDAEELTQDVFLKVFDNIGHYRGESSLSTWIYRIAYNHAISALRKYKKRRGTVGGEILEKQAADESPPSDGRDGEAALAALERSLARLPVDEAMLITLFYYDGKGVEELSRITGLSLSNVKVKLYRIRKKLYICMQEEGYGNG